MNQSGTRLVAVKKEEAMDDKAFEVWVKKYQSQIELALKSAGFSPDATCLQEFDELFCAGMECKHGRTFYACYECAHPGDTETILELNKRRDSALTKAQEDLRIATQTLIEIADLTNLEKACLRKSSLRNQDPEKCLDLIFEMANKYCT
jgi:uncharacterized CHY-type Zn-finger protein